MPQVPGTKVWIRKCQLANVIDLMEKAHPPERIQLASDFARYNIKRAKQAKTTFSDVYHYIICAWFHGHEEAT